MNPLERLEQIEKKFTNGDYSDSAKDLYFLYQSVKVLMEIARFEREQIQQRNPELAESWPPIEDTYTDWMR